MNRSRFSLLALAAIVLISTTIFLPVSGLNVNGTLGETGLWNSTNWESAYSGSYYSGPFYFDSLYAKDINKIVDPKSYVWFWGNSGPVVQSIPGFDTGAPSGASTPLTIRLSNGTFSGWRPTNTTGQIIGTGTVSYARLFNSASPPVEQTYGYFVVMIDSWNTTLLPSSGDAYLYLDYNRNALYNISYTSANFRYNSFSAPPSGMFELTAVNIAAYKPFGYNTFNRAAAGYAYYNLDKPSGLGISGYINKTNGNDGTVLYPSQVFIVDKDYVVISSDSSVNTNRFFVNTVKDQIRICLKTPLDTWVNSSLLFTPGAEPTPIIPSVYNLDVNTQYVNVSGTNYATISSLSDPSLSDLSALYYTFRGGVNYDDPFYEIGSTTHATMYELIGGTWYGYDSADVEYNNNKAGIPSNVTLKWDTTPGEKTLYVHYRTTGGIEGDLTKTIYVGQGNENLVQTSFQAMDGMNGGVVQMVNMQIYNHNTGVWTNLSPNTGLGSILTPPNHILSAYVQKAGFSDGEILNKPAQSAYTYTVNLYRASAPATGYVNEFVSVQATGGGYLSGATITITNSTDGKVFTKTSPTNGGAVIFNLTSSSLHTYTVVKTGYQTVSGSFTTPASGGSQYLDVRMSYGSVITTVKTTAPIPTGSWTVNPSMTPANQGNLTGFWSPWINVFSKMGASSYEMPLLIAGLIIIICMAAGFGLGGVLGGEVFMGFGAIFCVALGLIPIWVVLAIIVLGFLFYGLKIGGR